MKSKKKQSIKWLKIYWYGCIMFDAKSLIFLWFTLYHLEVFSSDAHFLQ